MASILVRHLSELERREAHLAVEKLHGVPLSVYLKRCVRDLRRQAREQFPNLFPRVSLGALKPIEKTVYLYLSAEGRRTVTELTSELGLGRRRIQEALDGLEAAGLLDVLDAPLAAGATRGRSARIYASRDEK